MRSRRYTQLPHLSNREIEILEILKEPYADLKHVANRLHISYKTVSAHLSRIKSKYKEARRFVNQIESLKKYHPNIAFYLRMRPE